MPHRHSTPPTPARPDAPVTTRTGLGPRRAHPPETPDTQEALFVPDGVWEVSEQDGAGSRTATALEQQIEADGLSISEDNVVVSPDERPDGDAD